MTFNTTAEVVNAILELDPPEYDDVTNAPSEDGTIVYANGVTSTEGLYIRESGTYNRLSTSGFDRATFLVNSPNGNLQNVALDDTDTSEISVPVPDGETLTVYRWGAYQISDGTAPAGLVVQLLDGSNTVQASENTVNTENTSGVASFTNSSGSVSIFKLAVDNGTGSTITDPGVGAFFAYEVS